MRRRLVVVMLGALGLGVLGCTGPGPPGRTTSARGRDEATMGAEMEAMLEQVKQAALAYLKGEKPFKWEVHVQELEQGGPLVEDGLTMIGIWDFSPDDLTLIREPDPGPEVRRYGLVLERLAEGGFRVIDAFWEKESFEFEPLD